MITIIIVLLLLLEPLDYFNIISNFNIKSFYIIVIFMYFTKMVIQNTMKGFPVSQRKHVLGFTLPGW